MAEDSVPPAAAAPPAPAPAPAAPVVVSSSPSSTGPPPSPLPTSYVIPGYTEPQSSNSAPTTATNGTATATPAAGFLGMSTTNWIIIGAGVGAIVLIILVALLVSCCISYWKNRSSDDGDVAPSGNDIEAQSLLSKSKPAVVVNKPGFPEHAMPARTAAEAAALGPQSFPDLDSEEPEHDGEDNESGMRRSMTDPSMMPQKRTGGIFAKLKTDFARQKQRERQREREATAEMDMR